MSLSQSMYSLTPLIMHMQNWSKMENLRSEQASTPFWMWLGSPKIISSLGPWFSYPKGRIYRSFKYDASGDAPNALHSLSPVPAPQAGKQGFTCQITPN